MTMDNHEKSVIRKAIADSSRGTLGIVYKRGAEWTDYAKKPDALDCSELVEGVFTINGLKMPDGAVNQFAFTVPVETPQIGDIGFFVEKSDKHSERKQGEVYHSGIIVDSFFVLEARAYDSLAKFQTGKVILRPRSIWEKFDNFGGWRSHPDLV